MSYFNELPYHIEYENMTNNIDNLIEIIKNNEKYANDHKLLDLLNKYLGHYLQMYYALYYSRGQKKETFNDNLTLITDEKGNTLLHHFAVLGYYELVEFALTKLNISPNRNNYGIDYYINRDDPGKTALMCVIEMVWDDEYKNTYLDICILLIQNNADWTRIFYSSFLEFNGVICKKFKKNIDSHIDNNIIDLMDKLKKMDLIDLNVNCVHYLSKKFGRMSDPDGFGHRSYYHHIVHPKFYNCKYKDNKPIIYLAILTYSTKIVDWLINNGAEMTYYPEYDGIKTISEYSKNIYKTYLFCKRKHLLMAFDSINNIKYLNSPFELREIASYL